MGMFDGPVSQEKLSVEQTSWEEIVNWKPTTLKEKLVYEVYYPAYRFWNAYINPVTWYRETKWFIQRGRRGWSDRDVWSADQYLNYIIPQMLRRLAEGHVSVPMSFVSYSFQHTSEEVEEGSKKWKVWLVEKAEWFEWMHKDEPDLSWTEPGLSQDEISRRIKIHHDKQQYFYNVVLPDFVKHWGDLWD